MYFLDRKRGQDTSVVYRTEGFDKPLRRRRDGSCVVRPGSTLYVGLSTDFFVAEADAWRASAWRIMRRRSDVVFKLLTKRAERVADCLPDDWGDGYANVALGVTCENQRRADERMPVLCSLPARHKWMMAAPMLGPVDIEAYLSSVRLDEVLCGGENYDGSRACHYEWVLGLSEQCRRAEGSFDFIETGSVFVKDGRTFRIPGKEVQSRQAYASGLSHVGRKVVYDLSSSEGSLFGGGESLSSYEPYFRPSCRTCGMRRACNGCSGCGSCR